MLKIKETLVLTDSKRLLEIEGCDMVLIPCDFLGGVFVYLKSTELNGQLAGLPDWKNIRYMKNGVSIRIWASRFPFQPQFFARKTVIEIVEQITAAFGEVEVDYLPLPEETRPT